MVAVPGTGVRVGVVVGVAVLLSGKDWVGVGSNVEVGVRSSGVAALSVVDVGVSVSSVGIEGVAVDTEKGVGVTSSATGAVASATIPTQ